MMTLEDEITEAQDFINDPPKNESNTCEWVILPLLWAVGYPKRDIESRVPDNAGQYPDYTLLPNHSSATFYLEAKAWNISLDDMHVKQALNYANQNGKRFVVLTNGQSWRLYDNDIRGLLSAKLITQVELRDTPQITDFLTSLSKSKVLEGSLERMAEEADQRRKQEAHDLQERQQREKELQSIQKRQMEIRSRLNATLPDLLNDSESDLVVSMANCLSEKEEFKDISPEILTAWFDETFHQPLTHRGEQATNPVHAPMAHPSLSTQSGRSIMTLKELQGRAIDGKKSRPVALQTPRGVQMTVGSWVQLAENIVRWLLQQARPLPLPFVSGPRTRYFLNDACEHQSPNSRKKFKEISARGKTVYMDSDRSGEMFIKDLNALCTAMQIAPDAFQITVLF